VSIEDTERARKQPLDCSAVKAPSGGICTMITIECGLLKHAGDSAVIGRYPDGDYVIGTVHRGATATIVLHPDTMKDLIQELFQLVQSS
jgi:hypothetical protein